MTCVNCGRPIVHDPSAGMHLHVGAVHENTARPGQTPTDFTAMHCDASETGRGAPCAKAPPRPRPYQRHPHAHRLYPILIHD